MEATNLHPGTIEQIYKIASVNLSPNTTGQVGVPCSLPSWALARSRLGRVPVLPAPAQLLPARAGGRCAHGEPAQAGRPII